jgi:large subunit ribosomal protein L18
MAKKDPRKYIVKVYRSNKNLLLQLVDRVTGKTIFAINTNKQKGSKSEKVQAAGKIMSQKLKDMKINEVIFDRSNIMYHGRVRTAAESLRENGITI